MSSCKAFAAGVLAVLGLLFVIPRGLSHAADGNPKLLRLQRLFRVFRGPFEIPDEDGSGEGVCSQYNGESRLAQRGCRWCNETYHDHVPECMDCGGKCIDKVCPDHDHLRKCVRSPEMHECHSTCMSMRPAAKFGAGCDKYMTWGPDAVRGCRGCEKWFPGRTEECMSCGTQCAVANCAGLQGDGLQACYKSPENLACHHECMLSTTATPDECKPFEQWGPKAMDGCKVCEQFYPGRAKDCMGCGKECSAKTCAGLIGEDLEACYKTPKYLACHGECMTTAGAFEMCSAFDAKGPQVMMGCKKCAEAMPEQFKECMACGEPCMNKVCGTKQGKDLLACFDSKKFQGCFKPCVAKKWPVDTQNCYFDKACHEKVDWDMVGKMKMPFFAKLKAIKKKGGCPKSVVPWMHMGLAKAGVPEDRVDYILTGWVEAVYPAALEHAYKQANIVVSGLGCANGYGLDLNQEYKFQGTTKDGRPYYQGTTRDDRYLYFDHRCADDTQEPRWLLGGRPDLQRDSDLNPRDGRGCDNDFSIQSTTMHLPGGFQPLAWKWCGKSGEQGATVSITYKFLAPADMDHLRSSSNLAPLSACANETDATRSGACKRCEKSCYHKMCHNSPAGSAEEKDCFIGPRMKECYATCMDFAAADLKGRSIVQV